MSTKFTVLLGIAACQASFQALVAVAIFVLFAIKYTLSFWMIAAVIFVYHGGSSLLEKSLGVKDWARCVHRLEHESMEHRVRDPDTLGSLLRPLCKDRAIVRDHSGNFVYNTPSGYTWRAPVVKIVPSKVPAINTSCSHSMVPVTIVFSPTTLSIRLTTKIKI